MTEEVLSFQSDVGRLLDIVAHSLYSQKEVFLRELVSNAADACDRLRYAALTEPGLLGDDTAFKIRLLVDKDKRTLTVVDNGIGMSRDELVGNLGTIARSGTAAFVKTLEGDGKKDLSLIGQFGVGFYAAFMVADKVEVISRKAGAKDVWRWTSDGRGEFTIADAQEDAPRGTRITLHLKAGEDEYLDEQRLGRIITTYSDHIAVPILFGPESSKEGGETSLNHASALWTRPKASIEPAQYTEFYHHVARSYDEPWLTLHWRAEGVIEYTGLLFVPSVKPFDLFTPERKQHVKLYVRRVFITDEAEGLLPAYLRFLRGIIDSEDLPLNISREMLQHNPLLAKIKAGVTKRVLGDLAKKAEDKDAYAAFWQNFGAVLKEGLYEDFENRDALLKLARFRSTAGDELVSLDDYIARMAEGQDSIFTITGDEIDALKRSPQLEGFKAKGVEVLLLTDPIDEFWLPAIGSYEDRPFKSVTRGGASLNSIKAKDEAAKPQAERAPEGDLASLIALFKLTLAEQIKDVRASERLTDSAVCLIADENDMDIHMERLLKQHKQVDTGAKRILELNPAHPLIRRLAGAAKRDGAGSMLSDMALLLLDQARITEGEHVGNPQAFAKRLSVLLEQSLTAVEMPA